MFRSWSIDFPCGDEMVEGGDGLGGGDVEVVRVEEFFALFVGEAEPVGDVADGAVEAEVSGLQDVGEAFDAGCGATRVGSKDPAHVEGQMGWRVRDQVADGGQVLDIHLISPVAMRWSRVAIAISGVTSERLSNWFG